MRMRMNVDFFLRNEESIEYTNNIYIYMREKMEEEGKTCE
jgi:hypothetical protein